MKNVVHVSDQVAVVRCRDCKFLGSAFCPLCWIENHTLCFANIDPDFYCAKGEKRDVG